MQLCNFAMVPTIKPITEHMEMDMAKTVWVLGANGRLGRAVALAFAPIFCANLYFTSRFKEAANPTAAFAANLFGAMIGGCLEYLSLLTGYRFLIVVAALIYLAAVLVGRRLGAKAPVGA